MSIKHTIVSVLTLLVLTLLLTSNRALAQENTIQFTVSPLFFDLTATPDTTIKDKFRIRNNSTSAIDLKVSIQKLTSDPQTGNPILQDTGDDEIADWISFEKTVFKARTKEWTDVPFTINIPKDAAFGYYFAFVVSPAETPAAQGIGTSIISSAAIPTLLIVKTEGAKADANLVEFRTASLTNEYLPVDFLVKVSNMGNIHVKPRGNIFVRRGEKDIAILEVNPGLGSILPEGARTFTTSWSDGFLVRKPIIEDGKVLLDDKGKPKTQIDVNWNKLTDIRFGSYTAYLLMVYDAGNRDVTIDATTTFWVIPYTFIAIVMVGIIVIIFVSKILLGAYVRQQLRRYRN